MTEINGLVFGPALAGATALVFFLFAVTLFVRLIQWLAARAFVGGLFNLLAAVCRYWSAAADVRQRLLNRPEDGDALRRRE